MSEDAQRMVETFTLEYEQLCKKREEAKTLELAMMVRANQMSGMGMLVPETNPDVIITNLELVDPASLR